MGRWADMDDDEQRLPEGFQRIGYDADTQKYTFSDGNGRVYESEEGNRYGPLWPVGQQPERSPEQIEAHNTQLKKSNRESVRMMLPFALLVVVFLLLLFRFINGGSTDEAASQVYCAQGDRKIQVKKGDTCWEIGKAYGVGVDELLQLEGNEHVDCERLNVGQRMCVPA
ncbi:carbohydrate-binding module family 50 protein [Trematosphaeria pertusa]|uniref:Carbohydrate-binding module family 50 protein n=1 Tax=Trematosphaeria pertusa TaxID=390896 RepID=A0A6A6IGC7_9PLEO|nr:carbohydrate-binding module family 50 protein [Trematosphaeria pertusa]KAF2249247.1 carbohydrate-binding module family 50 protein [Trematosphaeria pertusa]